MQSIFMVSTLVRRLFGSMETIRASNPHVVIDLRRRVGSNRSLSRQQPAKNTAGNEPIRRAVRNLTDEIPSHFDAKLWPLMYRIGQLVS